MGADFAELECPKHPPLPKPLGWSTRPPGARLAGNYSVLRLAAK